MARILAILGWICAASPALACVCPGGPGPCASLNSDAVVFAGRVLDNGPGADLGPIRIAVEEPLSRLPPSAREVTFSKGITNCTPKFPVGNRYVFFAWPNPNVPGEYVTDACAPTFLVKGNERLLEAMRQQISGAPARLLGIVGRLRHEYAMDGVLAGAQVSLVSPQRTYQLLTDATGSFEIAGIEPGSYQLTASKTGHVALWPSGPVVIRPNQCASTGAVLIPDGRISGRVVLEDGLILPGVTVQAFSEDKDRNSPLRTAVTSRDGWYEIGPLAAGSYIIGVNAQSLRKDGFYPPTVYRARKEDETGTPIRLEDSETVRGINLTVAKY